MIKRIIGIILGIAAVIACSAYFLGICFFQTHYKIGTTFNGRNCSFKSLEETELLLTREMNSYALAVNTRNGGVEKLTAEEAGLIFEGREELLEVLKKQDSYTWFIPVTQDHKVSSTSYKIDMEAFEQGVGKLDCMNNMVSPNSTRIETDGETFQVLDAIKGTTLDTERTKGVILSALKEWDDSVDLEKSGCYLGVADADPDELHHQADTLNQMRQVILTYDMGDQKEVVDGDLIYSDFIVDNQINRDKVVNLVEHLAAKYDTVGKERTFITYDERRVIISGGDYGWKIDIEKTADEMIRLMEEGTIDVVKPIYEQEAMSRSKNDISYSYLEIDTHTKNVVLYVDGNPSMQTTADFGSEMDTGCFKISALEKMYDGKKNYLSFGDNAIYEFNPDAIPMSDKKTDKDIEKGNGIESKSAAINSRSAETLFEIMGADWPVLVY